MLSKREAIAVAVLSGLYAKYGYPGDKFVSNEQKTVFIKDRVDHAFKVADIMMLEMI